MKKAKFGTDFQNNRANYWLYEKYSFDLHPEISKNPDKLLWPEITDVAKTDCRNLHEPAMKDKYIDLIEQTFDFPQDEFSVEDNELNFHDIPLMELIKQYGTPLKITYLPKISQQINRAKRMFNVAMAKVDYKGSYNYCYCTKSSHFSFVLEEAMKNDVHLETSSAYDIHIINALYDGGIIDKDRYIICNGFKRPQYVENIAQLVNDGFVNTIPVLDNKEELDLFEDAFTKKCKVGIRIACEEEPKFEFYTSRLGIRYNDIIDFYKAKLKNSKKFQLKMLHFFINTGIKDTAYYWNELSKCMNVYCELKAICPELDSLNIGGGFPIKNSLNFEYDYEYLTEEIIETPVLLNVSKKYGTQDRVFMFTSTSKITFPGAGVSAIACSESSMKYICKRFSVMIISYDKMNQLRHVRFLKNKEGVLAHMAKHRRRLVPCFDAVKTAFNEELTPCGDIAHWTNPKGGYFISLYVMPGCAKRVAQLCKDCGLTLTGAGSAYPYHKDPEDSHLRIAPTYPSLDEVETASDLLCVCVKLATVEKLLADQEA